jgi:CheY-like chemotaxis protein
MPSVLLVEDDESIRKMYATGLQLAGFTITTAPSGAEALVRVEEQAFDVILLDMLMIGMSGLDFLKSYDVRTKQPNTKVIALTNMENTDIEQKATALGATAYLNKAEYEPQKLADFIRNLLAGATPQATEPQPPSS